jgi:epoxyqueuosine reductase QueG
MLMNSAQDLKQKAIKLGFDLVGITDASPIDTKQAEFLTRWLNAGYAAQMNYLHRNLKKRINPAWARVRSIEQSFDSVLPLGMAKPLRDEIEPL